MFSFLKNNKPSFAFIVNCIGLFILAPFVYSEDTVDPELTPRSLLFGTLLVLTVAYQLIFEYKKGVVPQTENVVVSRKYMLLIAANLMVLIISAFRACDMGEALDDFLRNALPFMLALGFLIPSIDPFHAIKMLVTGLAVSVLIYIAFGLHQVVSLANESRAIGTEFNAGYYVSSTLANKNAFTEVLLLSLPFLLAACFTSRGLMVHFFLLAAACAVLTLAFVITLYVWLAAAIAGIVFFVMVVIKYNDFRPEKSLNATYAITILALIIGLTGFIVSAKNASIKTKWELVNKYMGEESGISSVKGDNNNIHERIALSKLTCKMIAEKPIAGWGLSNWKVFAPAHGQVTFSPFIRLQNPHNDYLLVWSEAGVLSLLLYTLILWVPIRQSYKLLSKGRRETKIMALAALISLIVFSILSFFGSPRERPVTQLMLGLILTIVTFLTRYEAPETFQKQSGYYKPSLYILGLLSVLTCFLAAIRLKAEVGLQQAFKDKEQMQWRQVVSDLKQSETRWFARDYMGTPIDWYQAQAFLQLGDTINAMSHYKKALLKNPYHMQALNDLGACYAAKSNYREAVPLLIKAHELFPAAVTKNLAATYFNQNLYDSAYHVIYRDGLDNAVYLKAISKKWLQKNLGDRFDTLKFEKVTSSDSLLYYFELSRSGKSDLIDFFKTDKR